MKRVMKLFFMLLLVINIFSFVIGVSASIDSQVEDVANTADKSIQEVDRFLSSSEARSEYLKQEWLKITQSQPFGKYILPVHNYLILHKQVFGYLLGINYQFSWKFFLAFIFWVVLVVFCFRIIRGLVMFIMASIILVKRSERDFGELIRRPGVMMCINLILFLAIVLLISVVRVPLGLAIVVYGIFSNETSLIMRIIYVAVIIGGVYLLNMIYKEMVYFSKIYKDARKQKTISDTVKRIEDELEDFKSGKKKIIAQDSMEMAGAKSFSEEEQQQADEEEALAQAREDVDGITDEE